MPFWKAVGWNHSWIQVLSPQHQDTSVSWQDHVVITPCGTQRFTQSTWANNGNSGENDRVLLLVRERTGMRVEMNKPSPATLSRNPQTAIHKTPYLKVALFFCLQPKILVKCFAAGVTFSFGANQTCNKRKLWAPQGHCSRMDSPKLLVRSHAGKFNRTFAPEPWMGSCARHSSCSQLALCVGISLSTDMEPRPDPQITSTNPTPFFTQPRSRSCRYQTPNSWVVPNPWLSFSRFVQFFDLIAFSGTCVSGIFLFSF